MGRVNIPNDGKQMFTNTVNQLTIHKRLCRGIDQLKLKPPVQLMRYDIKIVKFLHHHLGIIDIGTGVENRQGTAPELLMQCPLITTAAKNFLHLML